MEYKLYKIYDPVVNSITVGARVADCMITCNSDKEESVDDLTPKLRDLTISNVLNCSVCNISFDNAIEHRNHYKLDWHRYNLKRALLDKQPLSEDMFNELADDVSSISGSESEDSDKDSDSEVNEVKEKKDAGNAVNSKTKARRHSKAFFENSANKIFSVYRCLLQPKGKLASKASLVPSLLNVLQGPKKWMIFMIGGGHFAGATFENNEMTDHKSIHRYTVRAKQGGAQSSRDNKGSGSSNSAGASLRRYNEQTLSKYVHCIFHTWAEPAKTCELVFFRASGRFNRSLIFGGKNPPFDKNDPRLRNIPFATKRASLKEVERIYETLCTLEVYGSADDFKDKYPRSPDKRTLLRRANVNSSDEAHAVLENAGFLPRRRIRNRPQKIDRSKARSSPKREIPGQNINAALGSDSSDDKGQDKPVLTTGFVGLSLAGLREYDDTIPKVLKQKKNLLTKKGKTAKKLKDKKSGYDRQFASIHKNLVLSCQTGDKDLLIQTLKICDTLPDKVTRFGPGEGHLMTKPDFIKCLNSTNVNRSGDTVLHLAASQSLSEFITLLLDAGADPTIQNKYSFTPFVMSGNNETKNAFKKFVEDNPDKVDFKKASIPPPLTEEKRKFNEERRREKNRYKRRREKMKRKAKDRDETDEDNEKTRFLSLSDREKHVLVTERNSLSSATTNTRTVKHTVLLRCFLCGEDITGITPYEYGLGKFCSIPCVKAHRLKHRSYGLDI